MKADERRARFGGRNGQIGAEAAVALLILAIGVAAYLWRWL